REETSLEVSLISQFHSYSDPERDPRQHTVTTVFLASAQGRPRAADDAQDIGLFDLEDLPSPLAFDHWRILMDYKTKNAPVNQMDQEEKRIREAVAFLKSKISLKPEVGLILGTGLSGLADHLQDQGSLSYQEIPHFPVSTVESHTGRLIWGRLAGKEILAMQGRFHLYEGYTSREIAFPVRVMGALGIKTLILSNAAGGLDPTFRPGEIMLITDHINHTGENPLVGAHLENWGPRFPDMSRVYDFGLALLAKEAAREKNITLHQGVYVGVKGPSLETPAETRLLSILGAQAVGMSTIMEAITAVQAGLRLIGFSIITNVNVPIMKPVSLQSVIETAEKAEPDLLALILGLLSKIPF
ncbi:MAG TPA: purine-nucleoside phosphorylase, partial [Thermodesulfobacteriota bacterium]|nr:purine-nucleoside phosphorylase [Thermodesulfobacteriota bacterium]